MVDLLGQGGLAALERGYNVLIFEGPGQGSQLFVDNVPFRPDWQNVITPVVDWLTKRSDVATDKIALRGISFGGLLVPQAASVEHRLAAVIADPGSLQTKNDYPAVIQNVGNAGTPEQVNAEWNGVIAEGATPTEKFNLMKSMSIFSADAHTAAMQGELVSDFNTLWQEILKYDVTGVLGDITNPTMVTQYEGDTSFGTQGQQMYDALKVERKDLVEFSSVDGTQYHCGPMNPQTANEAMLDWVDSTLGS
jgi:esterase/lipase